MIDCANGPCGVKSHHDDQRIALRAHELPVLLLGHGGVEHVWPAAERKIDLPAMQPLHFAKRRIRMPCEKAHCLAQRVRVFQEPRQHHRQRRARPRRRFDSNP